jgi:hypothetical protein
MALLTAYQWVIVQRGFPHRVVALGKSREALEREIIWMSIGRRYGARWADYQAATRRLCNNQEHPRDWRHGYPPKKYNSGKYSKSLKWNRPLVKRSELRARGAA